MKTARHKQDVASKLPANEPPGGPAHDEIARRAYGLWEQQGRPQDQDVGIWLQAEEQLRQSRSHPSVRA